MERKIKAVENLDGRVIKTVVEGLKKSGEPFRVIVTPDHPTPIRLRTHVAKPVPYLLYDSTEELDRTWNYNEAEAEASKIMLQTVISSLTNCLKSNINHSNVY